jgi:hypothetical protein
MWLICTTSLVAWLLVAGAVSAPVPDTETIEVAKYDGSVQCEEGSGISLTKKQSYLTDKGIKVLASRRVHDCLMRAQVCGQPTSVLNVYQIRKNDLDAAKMLGFQPVADFCK